FSWMITDHGRPGLAKCLNDSSRRNRVPFSNVKASVTAPSEDSYVVVAIHELPLSLIVVEDAEVYVPSGCTIVALYFHVPAAGFVPGFATPTLFDVESRV